jgi:hypothetical protein
VRITRKDCPTGERAYIAPPAVLSPPDSDQVFVKDTSSLVQHQGELGARLQPLKYSSNVYIYPPPNCSITSEWRHPTEAGPTIPRSLELQVGIFGQRTTFHWKLPRGLRHPKMMSCPVLKITSASLVPRYENSLLYPLSDSLTAYQN